MTTEMLEQRILRLERQNRTLRLFAFAGTGLLVIILLCAAGRKPPETISAQRFELVNEYGDPLGSWGMEPVKVKWTDKPQQIPVLNLKRRRGMIRIGQCVALKDDGNQAGLFITGRRNGSASLCLDHRRSGLIERYHLKFDGMSAAKEDYRLLIDSRPHIEARLTHKNRTVLYSADQAYKKGQPEEPPE